MTVANPMRRSRLCAMLVLLASVSVAACDKGPTEVIASRISVVGGDNQVAVTGLLLPNPLSVRVTDSGDRGLSNVKIYWQITVGVGELRSPSEVPLTESFSLTNADGVARVFVLFTSPGTNTVTASVAGLQGPPVIFTSTVTKPADVVIRFGPFFDCTPNSDPSVFVPGDVTVPVGVTVEWVYADWLSRLCQAHIISNSVPVGGQAFDSGIILPGQPFQFVPHAAGTWQYVDAINGGKGTLTAKAP